MVAKKKTKSWKLRRKKNFQSKLWKASLFSAMTLPVLFLLLKQESAQEEASSTPITVAGLGIVSTSDLAQLSHSSFGSSLFSSTAPSLEYGRLFAENEATEGFPPYIEVEGKEPKPKKRHLHSRVEIGGEYSYVTLKPSSHGTFHGNLGGIKALYEYRPVNRIYGAAKFCWKQGITEATGEEKRFLRYMDAQERLGYTFATKHKKWTMSLFSGFGYRFMSHKLTQPGDSSLRFKYNEFYVPVGLDSQYVVSSWFSVGTDFTWMPQVFSTVGIQPLKGAKWSLENQISNLTVEVPFTFTVTPCKRLQIIFTPFYEYWRDGHSTAKLSSGIPLGLPGNSYNFYGADLNLAYKF